ncbi:MAG: NAD(P)H-hydrate dehydratase [bacterium]|nr:NAD(P)H-hydrate dehydratase [bacterium]
MKTVSPQQMREIDRLTIEEYGVPSMVLMENAGGALADEIERRFEEKRLTITVIAGPGNNGGDGMVAARHLAERGHEVVVFLAAPKAAFKGDAKAQLRILTRLGLELSVLSSPASFERAFARAGRSDSVIDSLFGTGLKKPVEGPWAECVRIINSCPGLVISADIPSGLDGGTGHPHGECVTADVTVTFGLPKTGLLLYPGAHFAGEVVVVDIGIPSDVIESIGLPGQVIGSEAVNHVYRERWPDTHKGTYGHVLLCCGSTGRIGAGILASRGALRAGAGLVTLAVPASAVLYADAATPEVMVEPLPENDGGSLSSKGLTALKGLLESRDALAIGPGLSTDPEVGKLVKGVLMEVNCPAVVDADALNVLAGGIGLLKERSAGTVLTPHPGEMARILGIDSREVQRDRIGSALKAASLSGAVVVLKGAGTVVAEPGGSYFINTTGNPGMATGGSGDVLTGMIGALLAMGHGPVESSIAAVHLHGAAGDHAAERVSEHALTASDIIESLGTVLRELTIATS